MSEHAPIYAPKNAPKMRRIISGVWQKHWLEIYDEPRLVWHRGKWYWAVNKPKELQSKTDKDKKDCCSWSKDSLHRTRKPLGERLLRELQWQIQR